MYYDKILLQHGHYDLQRLTQENSDGRFAQRNGSHGRDPVPKLYQSGYLTIKDYNREFLYYTLGFPNKEVEAGFTRILLPHYAHVSSGNSAFELTRFVQEVRSGQTDAFMKRMQNFFADCPYELARDLERHYQNVLYRFQAFGILHSSRIPPFRRPDRPRCADSRLCLYHGIQAGRNC